MIRAALALFEASGDRNLLEQALTWQQVLDSHYADRETGAYYLTADDAEGLVVRPHATTDDATPIPTRWRRAIWCGWRRSPATTIGAPRPIG